MGTWATEIELALIFVGLAFFGAAVLWANDRLAARGWKRASGRYVFVLKRPEEYRWFQWVGCVLMAILGTSIVLLEWTRQCAPRTADAIHSYAFRSGRSVYYCRPMVGWFLTYDLPIYFTIFFGMIATAWLRSDRVIKVS